MGISLPTCKLTSLWNLKVKDCEQTLMTLKCSKLTPALDTLESDNLLTKLYLAALGQTLLAVTLGVPGRSRGLPKTLL